MSRIVLSMSSAFLLVLSGCQIAVETEQDNDVAVETSDILVANFVPSSSDPANIKIPFPSDLLFNGSADGTLNIPVDDATDFADPKVAVNQLDGFSTTMPWSTTFTGEIDPESVEAGTSVRVFEVSTAIVNGSRVPTGVVAELTSPAQFVTSVSVDSSVSPAISTLAIVPTVPLKQGTSYVAALTDSIATPSGRAAEHDAIYYLSTRSTPLVDEEGNTDVGLIISQARAALPDADDATVQAAANQSAATLEALRQLNTGLEGLVAQATANQVSVEDNILTWMVTTQNVTATLDVMAPATTASATFDLNMLTSGAAHDQYVGYIQLPYYIGSDESTALNRFFQNSSGTSPVGAQPAEVVANLNVPMLVTVPNGSSGQAKPAGGWPVVIYQHGITSDRTSLLAIADTLAQAGFAAVAIDLPLHGVVLGDGDARAPYQADNLAFAGVDITERTFELSFLSQAAGLTDTLDSSGAHYINLANLLVSRDNGRQAILDLLVLEKTIQNLDYDDDLGNADFNAGPYHFLGLSLGAMLGSTYVDYSENLASAVLAVPGSGTAKLLDGSARFGPVIAAGLNQAAGLTRWSSDYESFLLLAQTVIDSSDSANYVSAGIASTPVLAFEIIGDQSDATSIANTTDQVIPNRVVNGMPLLAEGEVTTYGGVTSVFSGTEPFLALAGLTTVTASQNDAAGTRGAVKYVQGAHSSLLDPTASLAVTTEMQSQVATFFASGGQSITITDGSLVLSE